MPADYPTSGYSVDNEPAVAGFAQAPAAMQAAINYAVGLIQGYTNIQISYAGTNGADIQIAQSPAANPTSYAYYPGNYSAGGDIWFGTAYNYSGAKLGNYLFATALHELGHALGLKHSHETGGPANVAVPYAHDNSEYSIMSYRSYAGAPLKGYTAEQYGFSQTYMANDILALQTLYGANYNTQSGSTVYTWSMTTGQMFINGVAQLAPGDGTGGWQNRVFETIWDGNGIDTYDLSNYTTAVSINLNPGASSITSTAQLAYLGNGHYAAGNVYNAYLFNGDTRSYIENAIGGSGNDTLIGNAGANTLNGKGGADAMQGLGGNDTYVVDIVGDKVLEAVGGGYEIVRSSVSYTLTAGSEIEQFGTTYNAGTNPINLTGNEFGQLIRGNAGDNVIDGKAGADTMIGLGGNDNYYVDSPGDVVIEAVGGGYDIVRTSVSYTLTAGSEIEQFGTTYNAGTNPINLTGNEFSQLIRGNAGDNILMSGGGNDAFITGAGQDTIVFNVSLESNNVITIFDFDTAADRVTLDHAIFEQLAPGQLDASAFAAAGNVTSSAQHIIYDAASGFIYYDADGSGSSQEVLFAKVPHQLAVTSQDFFVI